MRILLVTVFEYPHVGGLSTHITTLKKGLEHIGHDVDVLSFSDLPYHKRQFYAKAPSFGLNTFKKGWGLLTGDFFRQMMIRQLIEKYNEKQPYDLINAQDIYATFAAVSTGIPTVSTAHGYKTFEAISRGSIKKDSKAAEILTHKEVKAFQQSQQVITVDYRIKHYIKKLADIDAERIHNFIDIDSFAPNTDQCNSLRDQYSIPKDDFILFVPRRLTKKNGVIYPVYAVKELKGLIPNLHLIYAGDGHERDHIENFVKEHQLEASVTLLGDIPHDQMANYYAISNVTMIPSVHADGVEEATSISALEAMGSGVPVIASSVGGLKEIVDHRVTGLLTTEKDISEITEAIQTLYREPELRHRLAQNARTKIENEFSHIAAAKKYDSIYHQVLDRIRESSNLTMKETDS